MNRPALAPSSQAISSSRIFTPRTLGSGSKGVNKGVIWAASAKHACSTRAGERAEDVLDADYVSPVIQAVRKAGQLIENTPAVVFGRVYLVGGVLSFLLDSKQILCARSPS
jgi:hypothetical protein